MILHIDDVHSCTRLFSLFTGYAKNNRQKMTAEEIRETEALKKKDKMLKKLQALNESHKKRMDGVKERMMNLITFIIENNIPIEMRVPPPSIKMEMEVEFERN